MASLSSSNVTFSGVPIATLQSETDEDEIEGRNDSITVVGKSCDLAMKNALVDSEELVGGKPIFATLDGQYWIEAMRAFHLLAGHQRRNDGRGQAGDEIGLQYDQIRTMSGLDWIRIGDHVEL